MTEPSIRTVASHAPRLYQRRLGRLAPGGASLANDGAKR